jgi:predicted lipid-binding transport protein (Tim44 family)
MSNNNNTLTEISALVLAALLVIGGVILLYTGKIDYANSVFFFISALGLFGFNSAWKAPSPAQQSQMATIASQQSNVISQMVSQQAAPMAAEPPPGQKFTTPVPQPPLSTFIPMPQAGAAYVPPPAFDRNWSDMVPTVSSQPTLPQVPTP